MIPFERPVFVCEKRRDPDNPKGRVRVNSAVWYGKITMDDVQRTTD